MNKHILMMCIVSSIFNCSAMLRQAALHTKASLLWPPTEHLSTEPYRSPMSFTNPAEKLLKNQKELEVLKPHIDTVDAQLSRVRFKRNWQLAACSAAFVVTYAFLIPELGAVAHGGVPWGGMLSTLGFGALLPAAPHLAMLQERVDMYESERASYYRIREELKKEAQVLSADVARRIKEFDGNRKY